MILARFAFLFPAVFLPAVAAAGMGLDGKLDDLGEALSFSNASATLRLRVSGYADAEYHAFSGSPPGLIDTEASSAFQPRMTLFVDAQAGPAWYAFVQARADRGFDPTNAGPEARIDEYLLRFTPWEDGRLSLQAGQFATVAGQWTKRHLSWQNSFISAPLAYEQVTRISDIGYANFPAAAVGDRWLYGYNPLIWGPSYATGIAASGRSERFEWAVEVKNAALSSRPERWTLHDTGFADPTWTARLGWRPDLRWNFGISASRGAYLDESAGSKLYPGWSVGDFDQSTLIADGSFEWRHLRIWAEAMQSRFEIPYGAEATARSAFLEASYKFAPRFTAAARLNRQDFTEVEGWAYPTGPWGENQWRLDLALTCRLNAHAQWQFELDLRDQDTQLIRMGSRFATRFTLRF